MIDISLDETISIYDNDKDIIYPKYMPIYQIKNPFKKEVLNDAIKVYSALKKIIKKYNLNGLTIRCFDFLNLKKATACLALAIFSTSSVISTSQFNFLKPFEILLRLPLL